MEFNPPVATLLLIGLVGLALLLRRMFARAPRQLTVGELCFVSTTQHYKLEEGVYLTLLG